MATVLSKKDPKVHGKVLEGLIKAYWMEIETVMSYIPNSINPDGVRAEEIKKSLEQDITTELGHATLFANRINQLDGIVPGSMEFRAEQSFLQPPKDTTDIVYVIKGVIKAEEAGIEHYTNMIELCHGKDWVTQDLFIKILADEEGHLKEFESFLKEYTKK